MGVDQTKMSWGLLLVRVFAGIRIVYGVLDNIFSSQHMLRFRDFLAANGFPLPLVSAYVSVWVQFLCGLCLIAGWQTRYAAALLAINFLIALLTVHLGQDFEAMTPAMALFFICILLLLAGPGRFAVQDPVKA